MALVAVSIVAIISMAALSIDLGTLYEASAEAQRAADAAALAAARTIAMSGITGDTGGASWASICGGTNPVSTQIAKQVAQQNLISGVSAPTGSITVIYGAGSGASSADCSGAGTSFVVNPVVTVTVQSAKLPIFFGRIFSLFPGGNFSGTTVSAKASAEAFNPSSSATVTGSNVTPVQPRCVKPLMIPNIDPVHPNSACTGTGCFTFVDPTSGAITTAGIYVSPGGGGVIGERFLLQPDCTVGGPGCVFLTGPPSANNLNFATPNLEYVPGQVPTSSSAFTAVPSCASATDFNQALAGCDQTTHYQCGVQTANTVDLTSANFSVSDTPAGIQCLIHQTPGSTAVGSGQDTLDPVLTSPLAPPTFPFQIQAGSNNPLLAAGVASTSPITSSTSIITLPIYDSSPAALAINPAGTTAVTIVGFLQVFVYAVDASNNLQVAVMNVSGCGNGLSTAVSSPPLYGTSSVPVRLITTPAGD